MLTYQKAEQLSHLNSFDCDNNNLIVKLGKNPSGRDCTIKNIGGYLKSLCQDGSKRTLKCINSDITYDLIDVQNDRTLLSQVCPGDPKFYQACGVTKHDYSKGNNMLCGQFICETENGSGVETNNCVNGAEKHCSNVEIEDICSSQIRSKECNDVCDDDVLCTDEADCNGFRYGKLCKRDWYHSIQTISLITWWDKSYKCNLWDSHNGREDFLKTYTGKTCQHTLSGFTTPILNFTRCAAFRYDPLVTSNTEGWWLKSTEIPYCMNMMDQTNCTDVSRVALSCLVGGFKTNISKFAICHGREDVRICDDGIENNCKQLSPSCFIHKHKLCDGFMDCVDQSDETSLECKEMTKTRCVRILGNESLPIPLQWLGDGITDCHTSDDEKTDWPTCGKDMTRRYVLDNDSCSDDFLCLNSATKFITRNQLCDMIDTCGNENMICKLSKNKPDLFSSVIQDRQIKVVPHCLRGLQSMRQLSNECKVSSFSFPLQRTFGISNQKTLIVPNRPYNCDFTFGETYILLFTL